MELGEKIAEISRLCGVRCTRLNTIPEGGLFVVEAGFEDGTSLKTTGLSNEDAWRTFKIAMQGR